MIRLDEAQPAAIAQIVEQAKEAGIAPAGLDGQLKALTAQIVEAALGVDDSDRLNRL